MDDIEFERTLEIIINAMLEKGYDPYAQLAGYLQENNPLYITHHRNARELIQTLNKQSIRQYVFVSMQ